MIRDFLILAKKAKEISRRIETAASAPERDTNGFQTQAAKRLASLGVKYSRARSDIREWRIRAAEIYGVPAVEAFVSRFDF